jgi:hypothetical protein
MTIVSCCKEISGNLWTQLLATWLLMEGKLIRIVGPRYVASRLTPPSHIERSFLVSEDCHPTPPNGHGTMNPDTYKKLCIAAVSLWTKFSELLGDATLRYP